MKHPRLRDRLIALILSLALLCQPLATGRPLYAQDGPTFLPLISSPAGPPTIAISAPFDGSTVGGPFVFAVAPTSGQPIERVEFRAGATVLGEDVSAGDGFRIFVEGDSLPAGQTTLTAIATGPGGQGSDSVIVQLVADPAQTGVISANGDGVFATETGSVITLRPGAGTPDQPIFVDELTQAEVTAQHNIDWEALGVTFLGAQEISSESAITLPLAGVSSAGFANRVQPGQAIVNYRLQPDADGDGVSEIVVVNTASVAPNGDVLADPLANPVSSVTRVISNQQARRVPRDLSAPIVVAPGDLLELDASAMNLNAPLSNLGLFESLVNGVSAGMPTRIDVDPLDPIQQKILLTVPMLPVGAARLILHNQTTDLKTDPIELTVVAASAPTQPAANIITQSLDDMLSSLHSSRGGLAAGGSQVSVAKVDLSISEIEQLKANVLATAANPTADDTVVLNYLANTLQNLNAINAPAARWLSDAPVSAAGLCDINPADVGLASNVGWLLLGLGVGTIVTGGTLTFGLALATSAGLHIAAITYLIQREQAIYCTCPNQKVGAAAVTQQCPPPPCQPGQTPNGPTGMGSAPPPGGNACGGGAAGGGSRIGAQSGAQSGGLSFLSGANTSLAGRIAVKFYLDGSPTPFSGLTDAGGYFFVPFVPEGEPFTAIAFDRQSGEVRTVSGIGPKTGDSIYLFFDFTLPEESISIRWDGGGDGSSWADARNWEPERVPLGEDRVAIDAAPGRTVYITNTVDIVSLRSDAALTLDAGELIVRAASTVNNSFTVTPGARLRVDGAAARFTVSGTTSIAGTLWAFNGGKAILPQATVLDGDSDERAQIMASGAGSLIDLSGVTSILGNTRTAFFGGVFYYQIAALEGAHIDLSALTSIPSGRILGSVSDADSLIDFANLVNLGDRSKLAAFENGRISLPKATNLHSVSIELASNGQISTTQAITLTSAYIELRGQALAFPNVTNIDSSTFDVLEGGALTFPAVTTFTGTDGAIISEWFVRDAGSRLSFPAMQTLRGNTFVNAALVVTARDGARVDLPLVSNIDSGKVQFVARGTDSVIDLSALARFERDGRGESLLSATEGGRVLSPKLIDLTGVSLVVDNLTGLQTAQIITLTSGGINVSGVAPDFGSLVHVDGASLHVSNGGVLALPKVTSFAGDGFDFFTTLRAEGVGSVLNLSAVTALEGNTFTFDSLNVQAAAGGEVRLPNVSHIETGMVQFDASGAGSRIDLSALADFSRVDNGTSSLRAADGGAIRLNNTLRAERVDVIVQPAGVYTLTTLTLDISARLLGSGVLAAGVVNRGLVAADEVAAQVTHMPETSTLSTSTLALGIEPAAPSPSLPRVEAALLGTGLLQIQGSYTQVITGNLAVEIGGTQPTQYDRLAVSGPVQLGGTLDLQLVGDYVPALGDVFTILSGGSVTGTFSTVVGAEIDETRRFEVTYNAGSVVLTVMAR